MFDLSYIVDELHGHGISVAIETQGTVWKPWINNLDVVTVSPKPPSSGNPTDPVTFQQFMMKTLSPKIAVKVVVFDDNDFQYAAGIFNHVTWQQDVEKWVQVGNRDITPNTTPLDDAYHKLGLLDSLRWLAEKVIREPGMQDVRVTPQLHTLIWGNALAH